MNTFRRRTYRSPRDAVADLWRIFSSRKKIRALMREDRIPPAFRERIMLTVTAVNRCRYCSYAHSREALARGIPQKEIENLAEGMFAGSPAREVPALLYAQHWAERDGRPEQDVREKVVAAYGSEEVELMEMAMRLIRAGNLLGNTFDYFLHRISFGRLG
ncbi:MAG: carboxymuconolactone decarboxylase family protein [Anaerolineales bacterium]